MKKIAFLILSVIFLIAVGCGPVSQNENVKSASGVQKATVEVKTDVNGQTVEQNQVIKRYEEDNIPGAVKYLYVISAYSGDVIIYSTVKGKVTSSGKRLTPTTVVDNYNTNGGTSGFDITIAGNTYRTAEVLQDDGTYGSSEPYIYWFDVRGVYHQHYLSGGQIIHVSSRPLSIGKPIINMELSPKE